MILSKAVSLQDAPLLTACAAVAAARAIDALYSTQVQIKWVNDLYLHGKKFCGILTEGGVSLESGKLEHAIIGIGINIRNTSIALPEELRHTVTSLEESMPDTHVCRAQLLAAVLYEMEQALQGLPERRFLTEYRSRSCLIGQTVELAKDDGTVKKVAVLEIADDCGLVVRDSFGNVETLHAGEVHIGAKGIAGIKATPPKHTKPCSRKREYAQNQEDVIMQYQIQGQPYPVVVVTADPEETILCQKGAMAWMTPNMEMQTKGGGLGKMFSRAFTGEAMFQNHYTAKGGQGMIAFASAVPVRSCPSRSRRSAPSLRRSRRFWRRNPPSILSCSSRRELPAAFSAARALSCRNSPAAVCCSWRSTAAWWHMTWHRDRP